MMIVRTQNKLTDVQNALTCLAHSLYWHTDAEGYSWVTVYCPHPGCKMGLLCLKLLDTMEARNESARSAKM